MIPKLKKGKEKFWIRIILGESKNDFKVSITRTDNDSIKKEFTRIINLLPEFDYYYRHGDYIKMSYSLPITIDEKIRKEY